MRSVRVRVTMRRLMAAIALVAVLLGIGRAIALRRLARYHAHQAAMLGEIQTQYEAEIAMAATSPGDRKSMSGVLAVLGPEGARHRRLAAGYERASRSPWLSVAPDPPPPR